MVERFKQEVASSLGEPVASPSHGVNCQCITCKWDEYKKQNPTGWNWSFISQDYSSLCTGAVAGSILTLVGIVIFKQWRQAAFGSMSSSTPTSKTLSGDPTVLINNASDTIHNIITVDPSVGILYVPTTAIYEIDLQVNLELGEAVTTDQVVQILIVKNGLPTDSAAILFSVTEGLSPGLPQIISLHGFRLLKCEDYIQVFAILEGGSTAAVTVLSFNFSMKLVKVQKESTF